MGLNNISPKTPGQIIKEAREAKHISINEVGQKLLLSKQIVNALEEDDYRRIPASVYAEGYLKAYAKFLHIPVEDVLKSFRNLNVYAHQEIKHEINVPEKNKFDLYQALENKNLRLTLLGVTGFLILGGLLFFIVKLFPNKNNEQPNINTPTTSTLSDTLSGTINVDEEVDDNEQLPVVTAAAIQSGTEKNNKKQSALSHKLEKNTTKPQSQIVTPNVVQHHQDKAVLTKKAQATETLDLELPIENK